MYGWSLEIHQLHACRINLKLFSHCLFCRCWHIEWDLIKYGCPKQTTFWNSNTIPQLKNSPCKFHWNLCTAVVLIIIRHYFMWWLATKMKASHNLNQWWQKSMMLFCVTRVQCVNSPDHYLSFLSHKLLWFCKPMKMIRLLCRIM